MFVYTVVNSLFASTSVLLDFVIVLTILLLLLHFGWILLANFLYVFKFVDSTVAILV